MKEGQYFSMKIKAFYAGPKPIRQDPDRFRFQHLQYLTKTDISGPFPRSCSFDFHELFLPNFKSLDFIEVHT